MILDSLVMLCLLHDAKAAALDRYPDRRVQIMQVGLPSVGYRKRIWFSLKLKRFVRGECDPFGNPRIQVVRNKRAVITLRDLLHEFDHWVAFAAGLPVTEHKHVDKIR